MEKIHLRQDGLRVELTNLGCAVTAIYAPDRQGVMKNIVAGYSAVEQYRVNRDYFGVVVGRYANRIEGGQLLLDGMAYQLSVNNEGNHLHGGAEGFSHKLWKIEDAGRSDGLCRAVFSYRSADGEEGYPGELEVRVTYLLEAGNRLVIQYEAETTRSTPVNLTNHSYFNLTGFENPEIGDHWLRIYADTYTEKKANNTSSGRICPVAGTALDFRRARRLADGMDQFPADGGYDHNFILRQGDAGLVKAAVLAEKRSGRLLRVYTDRPAMQVYSANYWDGLITGPQGVPYRKHGGIALETQAFPDSVHHAHFPDTILRPGEKFRSVTVYAFGVLEEGGEID